MDGTGFEPVTPAVSGPMATGQVLSTDNGGGNWRQIAPGTTAENVMAYVCSR